MIQSGYITLDTLQAADLTVYSIFVPLKLIRRRQVRASLKSFLGFGREDAPVLSSVML
jgi:hypothetical protein